MRLLDYDPLAQVWVISFKYPDGHLGYTQAETRCDAVRAGFSAVKRLRKHFAKQRRLRWH